LLRFYHPHNIFVILTMTSFFGDNFNIRCELQYIAIFIPFITTLLVGAHTPIVLSCNQKESKKNIKAFQWHIARKKTSNQCLFGYKNFGRCKFYPKIVLCLFKTIKISFQSFIQYLKSIIQLFKTIIIDCFTQLLSYNYCLFYSNFISFIKKIVVKIQLDYQKAQHNKYKLNSCCFTNFTLLSLLQIE
jgi:hypothetical protein